jgi:formate hydrogenlyase subunit 3/multisubunit Na+/H+ antiporter MnhD subunit
MTTECSKNKKLRTLAPEKTNNFKHNTRNVNPIKMWENWPQLVKITFFIALIIASFGITVCVIFVIATIWKTENPERQSSEVRSFYLLAMVGPTVVNIFLFYQCKKRNKEWGKVKKLR